MICYKDKTFCKSDCINTSCYRYYSVVEKEKSSDLPVAFCDFSKECEYYKRPDIGPWFVEHSTGTGEFYIQSDDFTHDVCLQVMGDFEDHEQKLAYCEWLCEQLNGNR